MCWNKNNAFIDSHTEHLPAFLQMILKHAVFKCPRKKNQILIFFDCSNSWCQMDKTERDGSFFYKMDQTIDIV